MVSKRGKLRTIECGRDRPVVSPCAVLLWGVVLWGASGCTWDRMNLFKPTPVPPAPADSMVLRGDKLETDAFPADGTAAADLAGAHELFRQGEYAKAEKIFHKLADNKKNSTQLAEEARYYEAESLRFQKCYPKAADTYNKMLNDFPGGVHREQAVQHMFEIANFWLEDTRAEMRQYREKKDGKRWLITPVSFLHFEKDKPFLDEEGRAIEKLEQVHLNNIDGPLGEQALFLLGSIKFYREEYSESDWYFSQLVEMHPNSPYAAKALELAIVSKHMSTGGSDYDGRKTAEAREMVNKAKASYPEFIGPKGKFLENQLCGINYQQAEKDYKIAEFYRRTGHPGAAYFYYEIVRRRYPDSVFYSKATTRMNDLRAKLEKEQQKHPAPVAPLPATPTPNLEQGPAPRKLPSSVGSDNSPEVAPAPRSLPPSSGAKEETAPPPRKLPSLP